MHSASVPDQPRLHMRAPVIQDEFQQEPTNVWRLPDMAPWCMIYREDDAYRMRFPRFADFIAHRNGDVECHPVEGIDGATLQHLYLNQVLPAVLSLLDRPAYHASGVAMDDAAILFLGHSGQGKSTLATYLGLQGNPLITDDGVELQWRDGRCMALPSHPAVRLWQDSSNALLAGNAASLPPVSYTTKGRYRSDDVMPFAREAAPLRRAYFLGDGSAENVTIAPLRSHAAHVAWLEHSPSLDIHDKQWLRSQFEQIARLVRMGISYTLDYPRRYDALPEVMAALCAHLDDCGAQQPDLHASGDHGRPSK